MLSVTPQRMRMIVDGFIDVLELGLEKEGQMVVSRPHSDIFLEKHAYVSDACPPYSPCCPLGYSAGLVAKRLDHTLQLT